MAELLLRGPRTGRDHTVKDPNPGKAFPGGEIYPSMPALGDLLAALSRARSVNTSPSSITRPDSMLRRIRAGHPPVSQERFRSRSPLAHNHYLGAAVHPCAFSSLTRSGWAHEFYDGKIAAGKSHHNALQALSNRSLEILWHCLTKGVLYDEAVHVAHRYRALTAPARP